MVLNIRVVLGVYRDNELVVNAMARVMTLEKGIK